MDFSMAAARQKKEQEKRRLEAKRKLREKEQAEQEAAERERGWEAARARRELEAREARERSAEEYRRNAGVQFSQTLSPVPVVREDDKIILPASALGTLEQQNALAVGTPLTFRIAIAAGTGAGSTTHAGVAEFTAEEGTVGLPPKVALCLTKAAGLSALEQVGSVSVTYSKLEQASKCQATVQPRGVGFHVDGQNTVNLDLQRVLERALQSHMTLSEGDWLPVRHEGRSYELVIRTLEPEPALCILNTELEVHMLPSELAEAERLAREAAERAAEARVRRRAEREAAKRAEAQQKLAALPSEPAEDAAGVVRIILRLPSGSSRDRRFLRESLFQAVLDWVEADWEQTGVDPGRFKLVQSWPGHRQEFGAAEASQPLQALGLRGRREALFLQKDGETIEDEDEAPPEQEVADAAAAAAAAAAATGGSQAASGAWADAERVLVGRSVEAEDRASTPTASLREEPKLERLQGQELVDMFHLLRASGMAPQEAAKVAQKWAVQLRELAEMGFTEWPRMIQLLEKYNGRVLRVANALAEHASDQEEEHPSPSAPVPSHAPKIAEVAEVPPVATASKAGGAAVSQSWDDEMAQLAGMGFSDRVRNLELLEKYQGRLERVVNILCGAD